VRAFVDWRIRRRRVALELSTMTLHAVVVLVQMVQMVEMVAVEHVL
jgi:hypothetical protein